jgi:hypothetical protein
MMRHGKLAPYLLSSWNVLAVYGAAVNFTTDVGLKKVIVLLEEVLSILDPRRDRSRWECHCAVLDAWGWSAEVLDLCIEW